MSEVFAESLLATVWVEAVDVLPRVARVAVDRVSIIIREVANTLDRVRLFFLYRHNLAWNIVGGDWYARSEEGLTRSRGLSRQWLRLFGHNLSSPRNGD